MNIDEYIRFLLSQPAYGASDPYAPSMPMGNSGYGWLPGFDQADLGDTSKAWNIAQDQLDVFSDPAFLAGIVGDMPTDSMYEMVEQPGMTMLSNASAMTGTIEAALADEILNGGSASSLIAGLQRGYRSDPEAAMAELSNMGVLTYTDENGEEQIDWDSIKDIGSKFQEAYLSDPNPGQAGSMQPIKGTLAEWYAKTGTPLPNQRYTADDLASPEELQFLAMAEPRGQQLEQMMKTYLGMIGAGGKQMGGSPGEVGSAAWQAAQGKDNQAPSQYRDTDMGPDNRSFEERGMTPQRGGWADDLERLTQNPGAQLRSMFTGGPSPARAVDNVGNDLEDFFGSLRFGVKRFGEDEEGGKIPIPGVFRQEQTTGTLGDSIREYQQSQRQQSQRQAQRPQGPSQRETNERNQRAYRDYMARPLSDNERKFMDAERAWAENLVRTQEAQQASRDRERIAATLAQMGHTPYNDTIRNRRMMSQYMGMGYQG